MFKISGAGAVLLLLAACASSPQTPEAMVYQAHLGYYGALGAAETYADLPKCSETQPQPCKDAEVAQTILKADEAAYNTLNAAQDVVRSEGSSKELLAAAAKNAMGVIASFEQLLVDLGVMEE